MSKDGEIFFMVDIESTGVNIKNDSVLEIGVVACRFRNAYWEPLFPNFRAVLPFQGEPASAFAKEHMAALYAECNALDQEGRDYLEVVRETRVKLLVFFESFGKFKRNVTLGGWNAASFDIPMLHEKGFLIPPGYVTVDGVDQEVGDHNYRYYEIGGAVSVVADANEWPRDHVIEVAKYRGSQVTQEYPGKPHDALYDCYKQLAILNGLICLARGGG